MISERSYAAFLLSYIREKVGCAKDASEETRNGELPLLLLGSIRYVWHDSGFGSAQGFHATCRYIFIPLKSAINLVN